ncbi:MAG TPA: sodium:solute symporter family protein [Terriglobales bacterium]|nr:sodium:solute symporter family protein [Terriglobales bacterium]
MDPKIVALSIISGIVLVGSLVGFYARSHQKMNLEQWTVGSRGFGMVLVWLLMAGEVYTTFTFLGASGWAYSKGGPVLYILGYQPLMYVVSFYLLPQVWELGRKHKLQTQADFFQLRYGSTYLSAFVALVGVVCLIPYLQVQLTGLGAIVEVASYGAVSRTTAMIIAFALVAAFVFVSGIRGIAWVSILKDALLLGAALFVGIAIPYIYFGGVGPMFAALIKAKPHHLVMPGSTPNLGHGWYISTVLLVALGFYMWPQFFAAAYTARSANILRRNAVIMPLYSVTMPLMFFAGLTAVLVLPGLADSNLALLTIVRKTFPAWFLGLIGGAGALTAMVPAATQLLCGATLYAKNLYRPIFSPGMTDAQVAKLAKIFVLVLTTGALICAITTALTFVELLLLGFAGVAQLFPGVVFGLYWPRIRARAVLAGMFSGLAIAVGLMLAKHDPYYGVNAGFLSLCCNFVVTVALTLLSPAEHPGMGALTAGDATIVKAAVS